MNNSIIKPLWTPSLEFSNDSNMMNFISFVNQETNQQLKDYESLWNWSVKYIELFWELIIKYFQISYDGYYNKVISSVKKPHINNWFEGISLNYAEHVFKNSPNELAILWEDEKGKKISYSYSDLQIEVSKLVSYFKSIYLKKGDVVVCYSSNIPQAIIGFLATSSIGGIWSSCSPDFGDSSVIDRFGQVNPKVFIYDSSYSYNGKLFNKTDSVIKIVEAIDSIEYVIKVKQEDEISFQNKNVISFNEISFLKPEKLYFTKIEFNEPLWVLYSSGTTGKPKAITHSVGGILLEHYKAIGLHQNLKKGERFLWYSTTGWMMWNYVNSALLVGGTVAIYDGSPAYPDLSRLWDFVHKNQINHFGAGAAFFISCMKFKVDLSKFNNFPSLRSIGSTGSPLTADAFEWIYKEVKEDLWLISLSGGTDICSGMVGGNPISPVYLGEIQCRMLGVDLAAFNEQGIEVEDELGELVIKQPMPSMPIKFWNDPDNKKYFEAYYADYKNIWRHGDWIKITKNKGVIIYGRSDSTLNRDGVRIGTSEIYTAVNAVDFIQDSIVVCVDYPNGKQWMVLFVVLNKEILNELTPESIKEVKSVIKQMYSPRHVPNDVIEVTAIPYTISGKKMETPLKKLLMGKDISKSLSKDSMKNPESITEYLQYVDYKNK